MTNEVPTPQLAAYARRVNELEEQLAAAEAERDRLRELVRRSDVYVAAYITDGKETIDDAEGFLDDEDEEQFAARRELVDDINEAIAVRNEIIQALAAQEKPNDPT